MKKGGCLRSIVGLIIATACITIIIKGCESREAARRAGLTPEQRAAEDEKARIAEEEARVAKEKAEAAKEASKYDGEIMLFAQSAVRKRLKYPDDSTFDDRMDFKWNPNHTVAICSGKVKAKNALGGELTHRWRVFTRVLDGNAELLSCEIDDKVLYFNERLSAEIRDIPTPANQSAVDAPAARPATERPLALPPPPVHTMRTWTSNDGKSLEGQFVSFGNGVVTLKKPDGATVKVPIERFDASDQRYIRAGARE